MADYWTNFSDRLPSASDADSQGQILAKMQGGDTRMSLWDWVPPSTSRAAEVWRANGFTAWTSAPAKTEGT